MLNLQPFPITTTSFPSRLTEWSHLAESFKKFDARDVQLSWLDQLSRRAKKNLALVQEQLSGLLVTNMQQPARPFFEPVTPLHIAVESNFRLQVVLFCNTKCVCSDFFVRWHELCPIWVLFERETVKRAWDVARATWEAVFF